MAWDPTVPAGTDLISLGDDVIRQFKIDIQAALLANNPTLAQNAGAFPGDPAIPTYHYRGLMGTTANLPTPGNFGLYFDTDRQVLQRDNGVAWEDIGVSPTYTGPTGSFPSGTKLPFYQATAPTGWTLDASVDDRFIRISSTAGGVVGGGFANLNHSHTHSHTHSSGTYAAALLFSTSGGNKLYTIFKSYPTAAMDAICGVSGSATGTITSNNGTDIGGDSGSASTSTTSTATLTHGSAQHGYADFIICTKD